MGSRAIVLALTLLLATQAWAQPLEQARKLMREYRYGQALGVLSSVDSEDALTLRFALFNHLEQRHEASALLKRIEVRSVTERDSFDQVQFFLARGDLEKHRSNHSLAEKNYREACRRATHVDDKILTKLNLARLLVYRRAKVDNEIEELFKQAGLLLPEAEHPSTLISYLHEEAWLLDRRDMEEGSGALYLAASKLSDPVKMPLVTAHCYGQLASYFRSLREHQKVIEYQQKAIRICLAEGEWQQAIHRLIRLSYQVDETAEGSQFYKNELLHALQTSPPSKYRLQLHALLSRAGGAEAESWARKGLKESDDFPEERVMLLKALAAQLEGRVSTDELLKVYQQAESLAQPRAYRDYSALDSGLGQVRQEMAQALLKEHRYTEALRMLDKAAEAEQEPGRRWHRCFLLNRASDTAIRLGDLPSARFYFRKAVEEIKAEKDETQASILAAGLFYIHTYSALLEGMESDPASLVLGVSPLAQELLRSELADERTYQLFVDIFNREIERERQASVGGGSSLRYRGILYEAADRREEARRAYRASFEESGGYNRHADLIDRLCLARLAYKDGGWGAAREELRKSVARAEETSDSDYYYLALGWAELELGEHTSALETFRKARSEKSRVLALYGIARAQLGLQQYQECSQSVSEALRSKDRPSLALRGRLHSVRGEARRLSGRLEESRQDYLRAIEALETSRQWASLLEAYLGLRETLNKLARPSEAAAIFDKANTLLESVQKQIEPGKLRSAALSSLTSASAHQLSKVGRIVASERAEFLLLQERLKRTSPEEYKQNTPYSPSELLLLREDLSRDAALVFVQSFSAKTYITALTQNEIITCEMGLGREELRSLGNELKDSFRKPSAPSVQQQQRKIYKLLLEPVEGRLETKNRWHFLPTPEVRGLPLGALTDSQGVTLSQKLTLSLLPQNPTRTAPPSKAGGNTSILLLGAPAGQTLKGAKEELQQLGAQFPNSSLLVGAEATTRSFLKEVGGHSIVHIASHASAKGLQLHDKYLSLEEIFEVKLAPGTLVVLSACETARSEGHASSLAEAFQVAGASTVIASLWKVDDLATAELFSHFYSELGQGRSPVKALALAQRAMQRSERWSRPYYWAGFVVFEGVRNEPLSGALKAPQ